MSKNKTKQKNKAIYIIVIIFVSIIIIYYLLRPFFVKISLSTIKYGNSEIKFKDKVKNLNIDFTYAETSENTNRWNYKIVPSKDRKNFKIKNNYNWALEKSEYNEHSIFLQGINTSNKTISIEDAEIEYIRIKVYSFDESSDKIFVFNDLLLGKSTKSEVNNKLEDLNKFKDFEISTSSDEIYLKINDKLFVKFKFKNYILNEYIISSNYIS